MVLSIEPFSQTPPPIVGGGGSIGPPPPPQLKALLPLRPKSLCTKMTPPHLPNGKFPTMVTLVWGGGGPGACSPFSCDTRPFSHTHNTHNENRKQEQSKKSGARKLPDVFRSVDRCGNVQR